MKQATSGTQKNYTLLTLMPFIIGTVIGIGSYFKIGKILKTTGGNGSNAIYVWLISIGIIIFSSLIIVELATIKKSNGSSILDILHFITHSKIASIFDSVIVYFYFPMYIIFEAYIGSKFLFFDILGIKSDIFLIVSSIIIICSFILANGKSIKFGKVLQTSSLSIKIIPLLTLVIIGLIIKPIFDHNHFYLIESWNYHSHISTSSAIISAAPGAMMALDGWQWATNIGDEVEGGHKTLIKGILISMFIVSFIYISYTLGGISVIKGNDWVKGINGEPLSIAQAFYSIFKNPLIPKIITFFIVISALGSLNGFSVFYNRQISKGAKYNFYDKKYKIFDKNGLNYDSSKLALKITLSLWAIILSIYYLFPQFIGINNTNHLSVAINIISELATTGLFSFIYVIMTVIVIFKRKEINKYERTFKLNNIIFIVSISCMLLGALFGVFVNFKESPIIYVLLIVFVFIIDHFKYSKKVIRDK